MRNFFAKPSRAFTLIELLVVIAIIGLLASIVTVELNRARNKAKVASVGKTMTDMRAEAEISLNSDGSYPADLCTGTDAGRLGRAIKDVRTYLGDTGAGYSSVQVRCTLRQPATQNIGVYDYVYNNESATLSSASYPETGSAWRVFAVLKNIQSGGNDNLFCVDSTGYSGLLKNLDCPSWRHWTGVKCLCSSGY